MLRTVLLFLIISLSLLNCSVNKTELNNENYFELIRQNWNIDKAKIKVYEYDNTIEVNILKMPESLFESLKTFRSKGEARKLGIRSYDKIAEFRKYDTFKLIMESESKQAKPIDIEIEISEFDPMNTEKPILSDLNSFIGLSVEDNEVEKLNNSIGSPVKEFIMLEYFKSGFSFMLKDEEIEGVTLYNRGVQGYNEYKGELPFRISFKDSLSTITEKLGDSIYIDKVNRIVKYEKEGLTIKYDVNNMVSTIYLSK